MSRLEEGKSVPEREGVGAGLLRVVSYFVAKDILEKGFEREDRILEEATGHKAALPIEAGFKPFLNIEWNRFKTSQVWVMVLLLRWTGLDFIYQASRKALEKRNG